MMKGYEPVIPDPPLAFRDFRIHNRGFQLVILLDLLDRHQSDVALAYGIRNRGGHQARAAPTIWMRINEVRETLLRGLGIMIDALYP